MLPAAVLGDDLAGDQEAGAADGAAGAAAHAGAVQVLALTQEPQGIACADPVGIVVLAVAVAGDDTVALIEGAVHLRQIVGVQNVIRVKDQIAVVVGQAAGIFDILEHHVQRIALAYEAAAAAIYRCTMLFCHFGSIVGAVVGHYVDVVQLFWIGLLLNAGQQIPDDSGLVAGRNNNGVSVQTGCLGFGRLLFKPDHTHINQLVEIAAKKQQTQTQIKYMNEANQTKILRFLWWF